MIGVMMTGYRCYNFRSNVSKWRNAAIGYTNYNSGIKSLCDDNTSAELKYTGLIRHANRIAIR